MTRVRLGVGYADTPPLATETDEHLRTPSYEGGSEILG